MIRPPRARRALASAAAAVVALAACSGMGPRDTTRAQVTVFAAASLTEAFTDMGARFEQHQPGTKVAFSFAASSSLAAQIDQGAPADVFASADTATMERVRSGAGTAGAPETFALNRLQIIVGPNNPKNIASLSDLANGDIVYVAAAAGVPLGAYTQQVLTRANVVARPKSFEADAKAVVAKVTLGEADAGIVYASDVAAAGRRAKGIVIPEPFNVVATYPIAVLKRAGDPERAGAFVSYVLSAEGQQVLARYGFSAP